MTGIPARLQLDPLVTTAEHQRRTALTRDAREGQTTPMTAETPAERVSADTVRITLQDGTTVTIVALDDSVILSGLGEAHEFELADASAIGRALCDAAIDAWHRLPRP